MARPAKHIEQALADNGCEIFARVVRACGFAARIDSGAYSVFAPTDVAFEAAPEAQLRSMLRGDKKMHDIVANHFALGKVTTRQLAGKRIRAAMFNGKSLVIDGKDGLHVDTANIVTPDIAAGASIIHTIDAILWLREPAVATR